MPLMCENVFVEYIGKRRSLLILADRYNGDRHTVSMMNSAPSPHSNA